MIERLLPKFELSIMSNLDDTGVLTLFEVFFEWNGGPSQAAGRIVNVEGQNALTPTVTEIYLDFWILKWNSKVKVILVYF